MTINRWLKIFTLGLCVSFSSKLYPVEKGTDTVKILIQLCRERNPEINSYREMWAAQEFQIILHRTLEFPQLSFSFGGNAGMTETELMFTQAEPYPGKLSLRSELARTQAQVAQSVYLTKERTVIQQLKIAYYQYLLSLSLLNVYRENIELLKQFIQVADRKYRVGEIIQTDVLKANLEFTKMYLMVTRMEQEKELMQIEINTLLNRELSTEIVHVDKLKVPENLNLNWEKVQNLVLTNYPELVGQELAIKRSLQTVELARWESKPDFMYGLKFGQMGADISGNVMVSLMLPIWKNRIQPMVDQMKKESTAITFMRDNIRNMSLAEAKSFLTKIETGLKLTRTYADNIIPLAEQTLKNSQTGYEIGKTSFLDLLDIQRALLQYRSENEEIVAEILISLSALERFTGELIETK